MRQSDLNGWIRAFSVGSPASIGSIGALVLLGACDSQPSDAPAKLEPSRPPDIVLVSIDSLRPDHLGCYGYAKPTSPTIDRLAREGVRCATAVSTTSWTLPAHAAMFTGLFDSVHGLVDNGRKLADEHRTLAEVLREAGYQTAGFFGGPYLHPSYGVAQGFDVYQSCMTTIPDDALPHEVRALSNVPRGDEQPNITGPRSIEEVTRWVEKADPRPFFLFLHLFDVHYDYIPPPEYLKIFDPDYTGTLNAQKLPRNRAVHKDMAPRDLQHLIALYDGEIRFTDDNLGHILAELERRGRLANALIVITADHGQEFFEHGGKAHQRTLFDEVVRVPMIFHWPSRLDAGRVVLDQVRTVDLMPTLLAAAGVVATPKMSGRDIGALLCGKQLEPEPALCELLLDARELRALRTESWKFVSEPRAQLAAGYDLRLDPGEQRPLAAGDEALNQGLAHLEAWVEGARRAGERSAAGTRKIEIDAELQKRLERLGYVGEDAPPAQEPR